MEPQPRVGYSSTLVHAAAHAAFSTEKETCHVKNNIRENMVDVRGVGLERQSVIQGIQRWMGWMECSLPACRYSLQQEEPRVQLHDVIHSA